MTCDTAIVMLFLFFCVKMRKTQFYIDNYHDIYYNNVKNENNSIRGIMLSVIKKINAEAPSRPKAWRNIAEFVISSTEKVPWMKLRDFSLAAGVSEGSVINFVRSLGYPGFVEFKVALAQDRGDVNARYASYERDSLSLVLESAKESLSEAELLDPTLFVTLAEKLLLCDRVAVIGKETSYYIAQILAGYLTRIGITAFAALESLRVARTLSENSALIAISYSGETEEILDAVRAAKERGACVGAITSFPCSSLSREADVSLSTPERESTEGEFPLVARIVELAVIDALCSAVISVKNEKQ